MTNFYVACHLGVENGCVMLGSLHKDKLTISEVRRFPNLPVHEKNSIHWDIPYLYQELLTGLREIGRHDEPVDGISFSASSGDYLLFASDGSLITPTHHHDDPRCEDAMKEIAKKVSRETIYEETGVQSSRSRMLLQLAAEKSRRLRSASHLLPMADGFNFLLSGVPRVETSAASASQLFNPGTNAWSDRLVHALRLPTKLLSPVVPSGTDLGVLRPEIAKETGLEGARIVASCSNDIAAALAGLPGGNEENCAFLKLNSGAILGTELAEPVINDASRELGFSNELGCRRLVRFSKETMGLWILDECRRFWREKDRELDENLLMHLAISAEPFESLINPADARFSIPGDMPSKIQAYCRDTNQPVPRKPGTIVRCVLESLALLYRKTLQEMEYLSGRDITRLYLLGESSNSFLNSFIANSIKLPVVIAPREAAAIGNVVLQAMALRQIKTFEAANEVVKHSFKAETVIPHTAAWDSAYERVAELVSA